MKIRKIIDKFKNPNFIKLSIFVFFIFFLPLIITFYLFNPFQKIILDSSNNEKELITVTNEDFLKPSFKSMLADIIQVPLGLKWYDIHILNKTYIDEDKNCLELEQPIFQIHFSDGNPEKYLNKSLQKHFAWTEENLYYEIPSKSEGVFTYLLNDTFSFYWNKILIYGCKGVINQEYYTDKIELNYEVHATPNLKAFLVKFILIFIFCLFFFSAIITILDFLKQKKKIYYAAGVLLIFKMKDRKKYIALVRRTKDAPTNPDTYSGLFGWADKGETNRPDLTAQREALEEILIFSDKEKKIYNLVFKEDNFFNEDETMKLVKLWHKKKENLGLQDASIETIKPSIIKEVEFPEHGGMTKIFILGVDFSHFNFNNLYIFDGERNEKILDEKSLLDRSIDFFEFNKFKNWWQNNKDEFLSADFSFKTGERIDNNFIESKKKISPSLKPCLDEWQKSW